MGDAWFHWRRELRIVLALAFLTFVIVATIVVKQSGPSTSETAKVVRFGSYADELGNHPTVIALTADGRENEIKATPALLSHCSIGSRIGILRKPHRLAVSPDGCR